MTATLSGIRTPAPRPAPVSRPRAAVRRFGPVLALFGTLKLAGFCSFLYLLSSAGDYRTKHPRFGGGAHAWDVLATWDGWWYQQIALHGYDPKLVPVPGATGLITLEGNSAAFFPLYPALMRLTSAVTGLGSYGAGRWSTRRLRRSPSRPARSPPGWPRAGRGRCCRRPCRRTGTPPASP
ncbi:hypothetical protein SCANM63S_01489 [Streptomyces canarius]